MLILRVNGTKNELKSFQKWIERSIEDQKTRRYEIVKITKIEQNPKDKKFYRMEVDLWKPLKGGKKECAR